MGSIAAVILFASANATAIDTKAKNMSLVDYTTGEYLYKKDIADPIPPASMSKLMTVYMIFDKIKDGSLSLDDTFKVSENAWRKGGAASGGSTMFLAIPELRPETKESKLADAVLRSTPTLLTQSSTTPPNTSSKRFSGISC